MVDNPIGTRPVLGREVVIGALLVIALIGLSVALHPEAIREGGLTGVLVPTFLLLLYTAGGVRAGRQSEGAAHTALRQGAGAGLIIGTVFVMHMTVENFVDTSQQVSTITTLGVMGLVFLLFGATAFRAAQATGSLPLGILASAWGAMIGIVITCLFGFLITLAFMPRMEHVLHGEYVRSGLHDLKAFVVQNTLESASSHLIEAPLLATVFGFVGGLIGKSITHFYSKSKPA